MERYIKYKRLEKTFQYPNESEFQEFLDELVVNGWEIVYYNEKIYTDNIGNDNEFFDYNETTAVKTHVQPLQVDYLKITVLIGKKQSNVL